MRIAILEDDPVHARSIQSALARLDHDCHLFDDGRALLRALHRDRFDMFILDWHVPHVEGPEVVAWVRRHIREQVPVLFVTSRGGEEDVIEGLDAGADDYMIKPIRPQELKARVTALLRRAYPELIRSPATVFGVYSFDLHRRQLALRDQPVPLKPKEYELALFLFRNSGRLLSHEHLLSELWGRAGVDTRTVSTHVSQLRRKLELRPQNGYRLTPVYGLGYRFEAVDPAAEDGEHA